MNTSCLTPVTATCEPVESCQRVSRNPLIYPVAITYEMEILAQNLITGKGLLYTEALLNFCDEIEGNNYCD